MPTLHEEYLRVLEPWAGAAGRDMYVPPERPDLWCYGSGFNGWGVQTNQKAFAALAVLATEPELDEARAGLSRAELLARALGLLRFSLASHLSGEFTCLDGTTWGHTWISALGIERMMHAVQALEPHLTPADQAALRRVLLSECDWLVDGYFRNAGDPPGIVQAGLIEHNHPENNLWNGVLLQRVAWMYPEAPRHADYLRQGLCFLLNGISIPADAESAELFDGRPLSAWHVGANFFPSYGLNHHRYLNVGYMVICLSQIAMAHFAWKARGQSAPAAVYHHAEDLWRVVKLLTFPDGRLARVGGDTRARYCYCQDYAIPVWLLMLDRAADRDAPDFERRWLKTLRREVAAGDGAAFLSARLAPMAQISPTYYTRLESDRAAALSMALYWRRLFPALPDAATPGEPVAADGAWTDAYHGTTVVRGARRLASWTWRAAEPPQGLCVPVDRSDMAEWHCNLSARLLGTGARNVAEVQTHSQTVFPGGFVAAGLATIRTERNLAEGENDKVIARQYLAFAALPDDATVIGIQYVTAVHRAFTRSVKGLHLLMPNDVFNDGRRCYGTAQQTHALTGPAPRAETLVLDSPWVNIDDCLTVIALDGKPLQIHRPPARQIEIRDKPFSVSSLYADEILTTHAPDIQSHDPDAAIVDTAFAIRVGEDHAAARRRLADLPPRAAASPNFRAACCPDASGALYLLVLNCGPEDADLTVPAPTAGAAREVATNARLPTRAGQLTIHLPAAAAGLYRFDPPPAQKDA